MSAPIDFYFDFSSPYGYFMAEKIDALAAVHQRDVVWRPFLLGAVYKITGDTPLPSKPMKGGYARRDLERSARFFGLPCQVPDAFPIATQHAARAFYWINDQDDARSRRFALEIYRAYFRDNRDVSQQQVVLDVALGVGVERAPLEAALGSDALKARLRSECDAAIARGVFGSPFIVIDGEPFWGADRLPQIERWLESGGF